MFAQQPCWAEQQDEYQQAKRDNIFVLGRDIDSRERFGQAQQHPTQHGAGDAAYSTEDGGGKCLDTRSEEHTSELPSLMRISYAVFCLKKKKKKSKNTQNGNDD